MCNNRLIIARINCNISSTHRGIQSKASLKVFPSHRTKYVNSSDRMVSIFSHFSILSARNWGNVSQLSSLRVFVCPRSALVTGRFAHCYILAIYMSPLICVSVYIEACCWMVPGRGCVASMRVLLFRRKNK